MPRRRDEEEGKLDKKKKKCRVTCCFSSRLYNLSLKILFTTLQTKNKMTIGDLKSAKNPEKNLKERLKLTCYIS